MARPFKIIDLFAGPGGLGEGFSAYQLADKSHPFKIALSVEKEESAHQTLKLRAFYRQFAGGTVPEIYYDFLEGKLGKDPAERLYSDASVSRQAAAADKEARRYTLGEDNRKINDEIHSALGGRPRDWVLIGGPPCQAYSVVGRARNRGITGYCAEEDHRNFLYKEYLKVIARFRPSVFVMENVKGLLSARVGGQAIFPQILKDLSCPGRALASSFSDRTEYRIFSLTTPIESIDQTLAPNEYIIRSENHGVPQARHRVILLGLRCDLAEEGAPNVLKERPAPSVRDVISDLPQLRSGLSKGPDSFEAWADAIRANISPVISQVHKHHLHEVAAVMNDAANSLRSRSLPRGSNFAVDRPRELSVNLSRDLARWYKDPQGWKKIPNHDTRSHIVADLHRYLFCAAYGKIGARYGRLSPKAEEFPEVLAPKHANWKSGHFADRFRVQVANRAATTVTSHISKDGHYFIHYDPKQCRSLTVREAARIQTFPDNYFFLGTRTQQYVQVGNAVPPFLAHQIADIVYKIFSRH